MYDFFAMTGRWRIYSGQIQLDWLKWTSSSLQTGNWHDPWSGAW